MNGFDGLLARTSAFVGGVLSSIQTLAGTTACKGVQIARLKKWAKENDCWIENPETLGVFSDRGSENEVYMAFTTSSMRYPITCWLVMMATTIS